MKKPTVSSGFTIVELLIVIIVIGILAGIVLVTYNGTIVSSRTQSAKATATSMQRKIEAYSQDTNSFPDATTLSTYLGELNTYGDSKLADSTLTIGAPSMSNGTTTVEVSQCQTSPGSAYRIRYYDFGKKQPSTDVITGSLGATSCSTWTVLQ